MTITTGGNPPRLRPPFDLAALDASPCVGK